jgi:hypothetical protein
MGDKLNDPKWLKFFVLDRRGAGRSFGCMNEVPGFGYGALTGRSSPAMNGDRRDIAILPPCRCASYPDASRMTCYFGQIRMEEA